MTAPTAFRPIAALAAVTYLSMVTVNTLANALPINALPINGVRTDR